MSECSGYYIAGEIKEVEQIKKQLKRLDMYDRNLAKSKSKATESELQMQVADYLRLQYPDVLFHSDFGSGIKLTMGQAIKQKRQNGGRRAWPDIFIAHPMISKTADGMPFAWHGLFLELKKEGTRILKKDGSYVSDEHIREQAKMLNALERRGYQAYFAVGFEQAKQIIDDYLGRRKSESVF